MGASILETRLCTVPLKGATLTLSPPCLRPGADTNVQTEGGDTPLHRAAEEGYADIVATLLEAGADPSVLDHSKLTFLHRAARRGHAECAVTPLRALFASRADPWSEPELPPLHSAAWTG